MPSLSLQALLSKKSGNTPSLTALIRAVGGGLWVEDQAGAMLLGEISSDGPNAGSRVPIVLEAETLGFVCGRAEQASALAGLIGHLASREMEGRALAAEVLHLYREVHLIEQLSEQLAALLNVAAVCESALAQAQRLIAARQGCILVVDKSDGQLRHAASFGSESDGSAEVGPLRPDSLFAGSVLERGIAEIINDCALDPRSVGLERELGSTHPSGPGSGPWASLRWRIRPLERVTPPPISSCSIRLPCKRPRRLKTRSCARTWWVRRAIASSWQPFNMSAKPLGVSSRF